MTPYVALGLEQEEVQERLQKIDVSTKAGLRDFALLLVLFTTGRRAGEVASLRRRHLQVNRRGIVTLDFERLKGAKSTRDTLDEVVSTVLILWVQVVVNRLNVGTQMLGRGPRVRTFSLKKLGRRFGHDFHSLAHWRMPDHFSAEKV